MVETNELVLLMYLSRVRTVCTVFGINVKYCVREKNTGVVEVQ